MYYRCNNLGVIIMKNYLANRRKELGLTMKEVADSIGVSEATVSRWESGAIANMRRDRIAKYASILDVSPTFIMTGETEEEEPNAVDKENNPIVLDDEALELLEELKERPEMRTLFSVSRKATKEDILKAVKIIEALKGDD